VPAPRPLARPADARALVLDMDGVLWRGAAPLPGLGSLFRAVRARGLPVVLATNNASLPPEAFVERLAGFGVAVAPAEILTSAQATALHLAHDTPPGTPVVTIGEEGVCRALTDVGLTLTDDPAGARVVVCGMDRGLTWQKLATATLAIRAGARFLGTNPDLTFPTERGLVHGNGAVLAALRAATGVAPEIVGKPEPLMYRLAAERLGVAPEHTLAVGDRLDTDILGAHRAGMPSVLVLSGVSRAEEVPAAPAPPTFVLPDVGALADALLSPA
jgi:4-nitrophenyl phosphatase